MTNATTLTMLGIFGDEQIDFHIEHDVQHNIVTARFFSNSANAMEKWACFSDALRMHHETDPKPIHLLMDFTRAILVPSNNEVSRRLSRKNRHISGRTAILITERLMQDLVRLTLEQEVVESPVRERAIFYREHYANPAHAEAAITAWLSADAD